MSNKPYADDLMSQIGDACEKGYSASVNELCQSILHYWGGVDGIVKELRNEFVNADAGSRAREQILNSILRILVSAAEGDGGGDDMDPEDARAELKHVLKELDDAEDQP